MLGAAVPLLAAYQELKPSMRLLQAAASACARPGSDDCSALSSLKSLQHAQPSEYACVEYKRSLFGADILANATVFNCICLKCNLCDLDPGGVCQVAHVLESSLHLTVHHSGRRSS